MRLTISLGAAAGLNILVVVYIQWYMLATLGVGREADALFAASAVPQVLLAVVGGSLSHVLVPILAEKDVESVDAAGTIYLALIVAVFGAIAAILWGLAPFWVPLLVPGFSESFRALTVTLARTQIFGMVFVVAGSVLWAMCHAKRQHFWPELTPLVASVLVVLIMPWTVKRFGVEGAAWLTVGRAVLQALLLLPFVRLAKKLDWKQASLLIAWGRIRPLLLGTAYSKLGPIVDRSLGSMAPPGGIALFYFAEQIYMAVSTVINRAVTAPLVPSLAQRAAAGNWRAYTDAYTKRLKVVFVISMLGLAAFLIGGKSVLELLIGHGAVSSQNVNSLWVLLLVMSGLLVAGAPGQILAAAFYARGNTTTPTKIGAIGFTAGTVMKIVLFFYYGIVGIAAAVSLHQMLNTILLYTFLKRDIDQVKSADGNVGRIDP